MFVYILANASASTLYVGVTNDLQRRLREHKTGEVGGFTKKYNVTRLVYYEEHASPFEAITREKQIKRWKRAWKDELIDTLNPSRKDLSNGWFE